MFCPLTGPNSTTGVKRLSARSPSLFLHLCPVLTSFFLTEKSRYLLDFPSSILFRGSRCNPPTPPPSVIWYRVPGLRPTTDQNIYFKISQYMTDTAENTLFSSQLINVVSGGFGFYKYCTRKCLLQTTGDRIYRNEYGSEYKFTTISPRIPPGSQYRSFQESCFPRGACYYKNYFIYPVVGFFLSFIGNRDVGPL